MRRFAEGRRGARLIVVVMRPSEMTMATLDNGENCV